MPRLVGPAATLAGVATGLLWVPVAVAGEAAEQPDLAFIEYLGSWEGEDSEWIVLAGTEVGESERRRPSAGGEQDEENRTDEETD